MDRLRKEV